MPRAKPTKPTRKMRQAALAALHDVVKDAASPPYARTRAAATLLGADKAEREADPIFPADPDAPKRYVILPDNGRDPNVRYGIYDDDQRIVIVPVGWPMEVHPESHYASVEKPADMRSRSRTRPPELLAITAPYEGEIE